MTETTCQDCGIDFNTDEGGHYIDTEDIGKNPGEGTVGDQFKAMAEGVGRKWNGLTKDDIGGICAYCKYALINKRSEVEE